MAHACPRAYMRYMCVPGAYPHPTGKIPVGRLSLARVAVVLGEGPALGQVILDDHVRAVEPVFDYLTRWVGRKALFVIYVTLNM